MTTKKEVNNVRELREVIRTISRRPLGCNPRHRDLHSHLLLIFEHLHIAGCPLKVFQRRDDPMSRVLRTNEVESKEKEVTKKEVWRSQHQTYVDSTYTLRSYPFYFSEQSQTGSTKP